MPITLPAHKLAIFFMPKAACTSLKYMAFEIENGRPFAPFRINETMQHIHDIYAYQRFDKLRPRKIADWTRLALVRDPAARVVSCYRNRVLAQKALVLRGADAAVAEAGLDPKPDLDAFVTHLPAYRKASPAVRFHTQPISHALGTDRDYYTRIYKFSEVSDLADEINRIAGTTCPLPHLQTRGREMSVADLSAPARAQIELLYAEDYALWGAWF